ncbi:lytic transglycosylase domain-containing protein [Nocardia terrae]|uniref:lytic transglycosylase domain-containing protein n=1 Tax=Nocardia terrae TaxID=2675851 RepID=UPI002E254617
MEKLDRSSGSATQPARSPLHAPSAEAAAPTDLPAVTPEPAAATAGPPVSGIPDLVLAAYRNAERMLAQSDPSCGLPWNLLAGIGRIESGHADGGNVDSSGTTLSPIFGPALDGSLPGNEVIKDGAGGYIRAVGPMQFLPSTWNAYASDGKGDGKPDPNNVFDAALAAGKYLCSGGMDLHDPQQRVRAVLRYNNSASYAADVLHWSAVYGGEQPGDQAALADVPQSPQAPAAQQPSSPVQDAAPADPATPTDPDSTPDPAAAPTPAPAPAPMIQIPGLPPIPCGIFCPPAS